MVMQRKNFDYRTDKDFAPRRTRLSRFTTNKTSTNGAETRFREAKKVPNGKAIKGKSRIEK